MKHYTTTTLMSILIAMTMLPCPLHASAAASSPAGIPNAHYHTDNTLDICVSPMTANEAAFYSAKLINQGEPRFLEGDCKLTVRIANNTGFANSGFRIWYDPALYEPLTYFKTKNGQNTELPVHFVDTNGQITPQFTLNRFEEENGNSLALLGWGTMGLENCDTDGALFSFFIRRKPDAPQNAKPFSRLEVVNWEDTNRKPFKPNLIETGYYLRKPSFLGDVDGNGTVDNVDAQLALMVSTEMMVLNKSLCDYDSNDYFEPDAVHRYPLSLLAANADINADGYLDATDAQNILLHYVECVVLGREPSNDVGSPNYVFYYVT